VAVKELKEMTKKQLPGYVQKITYAIVAKKLFKPNLQTS
jgi:hypothetical protein